MIIQSRIKGEPGKLEVAFDRYSSNDRVAIRLYDPADGVLVTVATVNIYEQELLPDEVAIKEWSENVGTIQTLIEGGIIAVKPARVLRYNFVDVPVYVLTDEAKHEIKRADEAREAQTRG